MSDRSKPLIALLLSAVIPGAGQIYNGEHAKGVVIFGCCLVLAAAAYWIGGLNALSAGLALLMIWLSAILDAFKVAQAAGQPVDFYYRKGYVVAMLLLVGPLALPLLWRSPNFSSKARWVWTVIVTGAALLFVATPYLVRPLLPRPV